MLDVPPTPAAALQRARRIAMNTGLHYVHTGNVHNREGIRRSATPVTPRSSCATGTGFWNTV